MKSQAQGTIEYLVIMAIVIVVGLLVVGMMSTFFGSSNDITSKNSKLNNRIGTGGISILESASDLEGDGAIVLKNTSGENLTITKITSEDNQTHFDQEISQNGEMTFLLDNLQDSCTCTEGQTSKTCTFNIYYTTKYGIEKTETVQVAVDCVADTTVTQPPAQTKYFIFKITTTSDDQNFMFKIDNSEDMYIDWGDGTIETLPDGSSKIIHNYSTAGDYNVSMNGTATRLAFGEAPTVIPPREFIYNGTPELLSDIYTPVSDGITGLTSAESMFREIEVTSFSSSDFFDDASRGITNTTDMFYYAENFNQDISSWDMSNVTNMTRMFGGAQAFNQNIDNWDVSNVTNMSNLFYYATGFNRSINSWDVSNVTNMSGTFYGAFTFNQPLNNWNTSNVTNMYYAFFQTYDFNQSLNDWDVSNVTDMSGMFFYTWSFDQPLNDWDVNKVTTMYQMFTGSAFNQPIGDWNTSNVTNTAGLFFGANKFNQNINNWDVHKVTNMYRMFDEANAFNQPLNNWDTSNLENMKEMFRSADIFNQDLSGWDVLAVSDHSSYDFDATAWETANKPNFP